MPSSTVMFYSLATVPGTQWILSQVQQIWMCKIWGSHNGFAQFWYFVMWCCGMNGSHSFGAMSETTHQCHSITSQKNEASNTYVAAKKKIGLQLGIQRQPFSQKSELQLQMYHSCGGVRAEYPPLWLGELYNWTPPMNPLNLHRHNIILKLACS